MTDIAVAEGTVISAGAREYARAQVDGGRATIKGKANVAAAFAWPDHKLVFEDARLAAVLRELNRYNQ